LWLVAAKSSIALLTSRLLAMAFLYVKLESQRIPGMRESEEQEVVSYGARTGAYVVVTAALLVVITPVSPPPQ